MTTVVFVHGINTRGEAYDSAFARIRDALARCRPDVALRPCRWGDDLGALLKGQGQCIPRYDQTRGLDDRDAGPVDKADLWEMLDLDPLFELRLLGCGPPRPPRTSTPAQPSPGPGSPGSSASSSASTGWGTALARAGLSAADLAEAHHAVVFAPEFTQSFKAAADDPAEVPPVWARAVVAQAMAEPSGGPARGGCRRPRALVAGLTSEITAGVQPKGLAGEWLGHAPAVFGTRHALSRRGNYTRELIVPAVGDVLVYQGRGRAIRQRIATASPSTARSCSWPTAWAASPASTCSPRASCPRSSCWYRRLAGPVLLRDRCSASPPLRPVAAGAFPALAEPV